MARPKKYDVDPEQIEKLASYGCTYEEIGAIFNVKATSLRKSYSQYYQKGREGMKRRLRMAQLKNAFDGNAVMQIWLGKQYLGQTDKNDIELKADVKEVIEVQFV